MVTFHIIWGLDCNFLTSRTKLDIHVYSWTKICIFPKSLQTKSHNISLGSMRLPDPKYKNTNSNQKVKVICFRCSTLAKFHLITAITRDQLTHDIQCLSSAFTPCPIIPYYPYSKNVKHLRTSCKILNEATR